MGFYDDEDNVETYVKMAEGYDGRELVAALRQHLPPGATVLELGMGPGKDLALLAEAFTATGSDRSEIFLRRYRRDHPDADLLLLDAVTLETERCFDAIYSNKVLHHLSVDELRKSLHRQVARLNADGLLCTPSGTARERRSITDCGLLIILQSRLQQFSAQNSKRLPASATRR